MKNQTKLPPVVRESSTAETGKAISPKAEQFPIVGMGASAGGLEALEQFFTHMPGNCGMAFVIIQHLDPTHKGIMPELLQRITPLRVETVTDRLKIKPNSVYVIPPNTSMSILNGALYLFEPIETRGLRLPVDFFFRSLADDQREKSIGIILSGMGSDGSAGLKAIKENAGLVLVQDPASAKFDSMPRMAIESVVVDIVAPAQDLPAKLIDLIKMVPRPNALQEIEKDSSSLEKIIILLRTQTGNDFSQYKHTTLYRRIERRMGIHQILKIAWYVRYLSENPPEVDILFKELLIGVTNFFRDLEVWEHLKEKVLPSLLAKLPHGYVLRAWIPGCSTGEEAYSLAIIFKEALEKRIPNKSLSLQIFATDLDGAAIEKARRGIYTVNIQADVSPDRLNRFFVKTGEHYRVNAEIREMVVFASQNVIKDPPFTKLDLLSCRNLLIYLDSELQSKLLALFHYSLHPGGILLLGSAETNAEIREMVVFASQNVIKDPPFTKLDLLSCRNLLIYLDSELQSKLLALFHYSLHPGGILLLGSAETNAAQSDLFSTIDSKFRLYQRSGSVKREELANFPSSFTRSKTGIREHDLAAKVPDNIQTLTDQLLLQQFIPSSLLVSSQGDILYITGSTGKYLEPAAGKANMNIFAMAREGLRNELPMAFRTVNQSFDKLVLSNLKVTNHDKSHLVDVTIQQIEKPLTLKGRILIIFKDVEEVELSLTEKRKRSTGKTSKVDLEYELLRAREELQSTMEEMQTSQEELQSTNEEMQSTNEELQSTNEELTTSKEEMQSMNEELHTLNAELQSKIDDSIRASNDMNNLLNSIDIATLFLEKDLRIRQFTNPTTRIFKLIQSDIGRPFSDQVTDLDYPELYQDAREVLRTLVFVEKQVTTLDGRWFKIRIMPYRTSDDKIDGLVITFIEITQSKQLENDLKQFQLMLQSFIHAVPSVIVGLSSDGKIIEMNAEAEELFGCKREEVLGEKYIDLFIPPAKRKEVEADMKKLLAGSFPNRIVNDVKTINGNEFTVEWSAHQLMGDQGKLTAMMAIGINLSKA